MKKGLIIYLLGMLMLPVTSMAQDIQFTQFHATPLYLNPALTGGQVTSRAAVHYRNQWIGIGNGYSTMLASFDHQNYGSSLGWGIQVIQDRQGQTGPTSTDVQGSFAYSWAVSDYVQVRAGLQGGIVSKGIDYSRLQFVDQFNNTGLVRPGNGEDFAGNRITYPEFAAGGLIYAKGWWVGLAAHHLSRPRQSFFNDALSTLPIRYTLHAGTRIYVNHGTDYYPTNPSQDMYFSPMIQYRMQQDFDQLDIGLQFHLSPLTIGLWYRGLPALKSYESLPNNDALAVLLGFEFESGLAFGYSYDVTVSTFGNGRTGGAHEISLIYQWAMGDKAKRAKAGIKKGVRFDVPCPKL